MKVSAEKLLSELALVKRGRFGMFKGLILAALFSAPVSFAFSQEVASTSPASAQATSENSGVPTSLEQATAELSKDSSLRPSAPEKKPVSVAVTDPFTSSVETTLFDVYLGDKLKGAVLADYTDEWLLISEPADLITQLTDLKNGERLIPLLTNKIRKRREIKELGAVHYDVNTFSITIEPSAELLKARSMSIGRRVGDPENAPSLQQRVGIVSSGSTEGETNSAFSHRGIASYGAFMAMADGAVVSDRDYELNQATAAGIFGDYRASAGLLQTTGHSFAPSLQYSGIKLETAEELFLDQDLIHGSQFQIFVPSRSRVEFYRDGRLISTQVLDFGLREIDTTSFPQGSYDVDVVIIDSFGNATRQRKFFTKAGFLASRAQPIFTVQGGSIRDNLDSLDEPVYQAGVRWRATDIFDLSTSLYGSEDLQIGTIETVGLYRDFRFSLGLNESTEQDRGITSSIGATILGFNLFANHSETLKGGIVPDVVDEDENEPFDPVFDLRDRQTELLFQDRYNHSYSIARRMGNFHLRYVYEESSGEGTRERFSRGPYFEWILRDAKFSSLRFQASLLDTDRGDIRSAGLMYGYRLTNNLTVGAQLSHFERDTGDETVLLASLGYDGKNTNEVGDRAQFTSEVRDRDIKSQGRETSVNTQLNVDTTGDLAQVVGFVRNSRTDNRDNTAYGVNGQSSFMVASDSTVSISHPVNREAVFIAEVDSKTTDSPFEILMNEQIVGTVAAGERAVIGVAPYRTYEVRVRPQEGGDLVSYESNEAKVTIFPGNVVKRSWQVEKVFILIGRIVDEHGEPLARKRIKGTKEYTVTEEDGTFQAEVGGYETLKIESESHSCTISFDFPETPGYFFDIGDFPCLSDGIELDGL